MFILTELSREFYNINLELKGLLSEITEEISISPTSLTVSPEEAVYDPQTQAHQLLVVRDGYVKLEHGEKLIAYFEAGDLMGFGSQFTLSEVRVSSEFTVHVDCYSKAEFLAALQGTADLQGKWNRYVELLLGLQALIVSKLTSEDLRIAPETIRFEAGDPIIIQNTEPHQVFTLLSGAANVYVHDKKVGEVLTGEIFGAMAATNNTRRTASVIAESACLVLALPKKHFLALAETHPKTVLKLIEDMSRIIVSQNSKLVDYE